jgi:hypothetical protein
MPRNKAAIIYVLLAVAAFLSFWQVNHCGFIDLDDKTYVTETGTFGTGLRLKGFCGHSGRVVPPTGTL